MSMLHTDISVIIDNIESHVDKTRAKAISKLEHLKHKYNVKYAMLEEEEQAIIEDKALIKIIIKRIDETISKLK